MLVFEILECVLYHEQKLCIFMSKGGSNMLKTRGYDSEQSTYFFVLKQPLNSLVEIAAGALVAVVVVVVANTPDRCSQHLSQTESVKCPACAVFAKC